jgi:hypothetical protein
MLYNVSNGMVRTAEEPYEGVLAADYPMKYTEVIHQVQQKHSYYYQRFNVLYNIFLPTGPSSHNTPYV